MPRPASRNIARRGPHRVLPRWLFLSVALIGVLASIACRGSDSDRQSTAAQPADATSAAAVSVAATAPAKGCREITHKLGTACVPNDANRIVVLDPLTALPTLLDVGAGDRIVGSATVYPTGRLYPQYITEAEVAKIATVGSMRQLDMEKIAALTPDLILGMTSQVQPIQAQLETIAPTVATEFAFYTTEWRDAVRTIADSVGKKDAAERRIRELDARIAGVKAKVTAAGKPLSLSRVDFFQGAPLYYRYGCTFFGDLLSDAGIRQPSGQQSACEAGTGVASAVVNISLERIGLLEADAIVSYVQPATSSDAKTDPFSVVADNPLWKQLNAVKAGRVYAFGDAWGLGADLRAANIILEDIESSILAKR